MNIIVNMSGPVWARKTTRRFLHLHSSDSRGQSFSGEPWAILVNAESQEGNGEFSWNSAQRSTLTPGWTDYIVRSKVKNLCNLRPHVMNQFDPIQ